MRMAFTCSVPKSRRGSFRQLVRKGIDVVTRLKNKRFAELKKGHVFTTLLTY